MQNLYFVSHGGNGKPSYSANIYSFKVNNNRNTIERCEICSTLTMKAPEQRQ